MLGKEHPDTLKSMHWLAFLLHNLKQYEESEHWFELTLKLHEKVLGDEHPSTVGTRADVAAMVQKKDSGGQT